MLFIASSVFANQFLGFFIILLFVCIDYSNVKELVIIYPWLHNFFTRVDGS